LLLLSQFINSLVIKFALNDISCKFYLYVLVSFSSHNKLIQKIFGVKYILVEYHLFQQKLLIPTIQFYKPTCFSESPVALFGEQII